MYVVKRRVLAVATVGLPTTTVRDGTGNDGVVGGLGIDVVRYNDITAGGVTVDLGAQTVTGPTAVVWGSSP